MCINENAQRRPTYQQSFDSQQSSEDPPETVNNLAIELVDGLGYSDAHC